MVDVSSFHTYLTPVYPEPVEEMPLHYSVNLEGTTRLLLVRESQDQWQAISGTEYVREGEVSLR